MFSKAVKWGYITKNPATNAELPKLEEEEAAYFEEDDVRCLLTLLHNEPIKYLTIVAVDLFSGLRRSEICSLRWSNVSFKDQTISIKKGASYVRKHGIRDEKPKSKKSKRIMKLSRLAFSLLREYKEWQDSQRIACGDYWKNTDDFVFTSDDGRRMHPDSLTKWFKNFLRKHGFPEDLHFHSLRHTAASILIDDGTNIVVVSKRLGHAQVSTTSNIYAHMIRSADEKAAEVADKFIDAFDTTSP